MKKAVLLFLLVVGSITTYAQSKIGGGLAYGTDIEEPGLFIQGEFHIKSNLSIAPDVIIYFVDDSPGVKRGFWEFNANVNYYFTEGAARVYGLAGLNYATATVDIDGFGDDSNSELGINLGIGANFDINSPIEPFTEFKLTVSDFDQAVLKFGIKYKL
jgi:outer membrane immunogenic protein